MKDGAVVSQTCSRHVRRPAFLDQPEADQRAQVFERLGMIAVEHDPVQPRHRVAFQHAAAPVQEQLASVFDLLA